VLAQEGKLETGNSHVPPAAPGSYPHRELLAAIQRALQVPMPADPGQTPDMLALRDTRTLAVQAVIGRLLAYRDNSDDDVMAAVYQLRAATDDLPVAYQPQGAAR
jgi:hypothetical protein